MFSIPEIYITNLISILEWYLRMFHDLVSNVDYDTMELKRLINILYEDKTHKVENRYLYCLSNAIQTAMNYINECSISKQELNDIYDWFMPIYLKK